MMSELTKQKEAGRRRKRSTPVAVFFVFLLFLYLFRTGYVSSSVEYGCSTVFTAEAGKDRNPVVPEILKKPVYKIISSAVRQQHRVEAEEVILLRQEIIFLPVMLFGMQFFFSERGQLAVYAASRCYELSEVLQLILVQEQKDGKKGFL